MIYKKFSDLEEIKGMCNSQKLPLLDEKIIVFERMPFFGYKQKMSESIISKILDDVKKYDIIIINDYEHIYVAGWIRLLEELNKAGKIIFITTFTIGIKQYVDKMIPNNNIFFDTIKNKLNSFITDKDFHINLNIEKKREYLIKFFSYNRTPARDYIIQYLINNNLIEANNISFHNYPVCNYNEKIIEDGFNLNTINSLYSFYEVNDFLKVNNVDIPYLNKLKIVPESEKFDIEEQNIQFDRNIKAGCNSYFEIMSESQTPISNDINNQFYYTYSISRRLLNPIIYGNVFHIMPYSELFYNDLQSEGFELYFKSNAEFINNCNEDFYFLSDTQKKLKHNYQIVKELYDKNNRVPFFYMKYLKEIFPNAIERIFQYK